ncbi:MAG: hypothetical protein J6A85_02820 [Clostridia bacterium]|nr:hypothetical protein [Clostridia bacterium]
MAYDTFICYRGQKVDDGISEKIGRRIYELIKNDEDFGEVFFAPELKNNYNFIEDTKTIMPNLKRMIVVLCPDFFDGINKSDTLTDASPIYHEFFQAFKNEKCVFIPVFVYGFTWKDDILVTLKRYFSENDLNRIVHMSGLRLAGNEFKETDVKYLMSVCEGGDTISRNVIDMCIDDLKACSTTVGDAIVPLDKNTLETDYYSYLYYCDRENTRFFPKLFLDTLNVCIKNFSIVDSDFVYWPIDLVEREYADKDISICSICFGIMILNNWLNKDIQYTNCAVDTATERAFQSAINGAMNLLISLRSPKCYSWPSIWEFDKKSVEGTINQTTLSLSTLLSGGFLSFPSNLEEDIRKDVFLKRYNFIAQSADWLIRSSNYSTFLDKRSWGYMATNKTSAILPTAFAFDTLLKFKKCLEVALPEFDNDCKQNELRLYMDKLQVILSSTINYFKHTQNSSDGYFMSPTGEPSITHTSKVLKSLVTYARNSEPNEMVDEMIGKAFCFLINKDSAAVMNLPKNEMFERFQYTEKNSVNLCGETELDKNDGEDYENCGELLYLDALLNAHGYYKTVGNSPSLGFENKVCEIWKLIRERNVKRTPDNWLIYAGKRSAYPKYPIYSLYYYRMVCSDIIEYNAWSNRENV